MSRADAMDYEKAKRLAADPDADIRRNLAQRQGLAPEILFYLAEDASAEVRRAVAENRETPRHADLLLTKDADVSVRERLAGKIGAMVPDLDPGEKERIRELTNQVLEALARDQAVRVRQIVAEALKDVVNAPIAVIQKLARDIEIKVAGPVLEFSPLLSDEDLLEIISAGPIKGALAAIAKRRELNAKVSDAVVVAVMQDPLESATVRKLLENGSAQIREDTLDRILDQAPKQPTWHEPLVERPKLPLKAMKRLAEFVGKSLLEALQKRPDLDEATARDVAQAVQKRLAAEGGGDGGAAPVGEEAISAAIAAGKQEAIAAVLARDAKLPPATVASILASKSAKAVTALAWRAKLSMRQALQLQLRIAHIPPTSALNPRGGTDYPLTPAEMEWQLGLFGAE